MQRGQASVEYVAIVALVAVVMASAGAVAWPSLPGTVVHHLRVALCIVGGDVCRAADARARGLEPCVLEQRRHDEEQGVTIGFIRLGTGTGALLERRSDGTYRLSLEEGAGGDVTAGVGIHLGGVHAGGDVSGGLSFRSGRAWELPDLDAVQRLRFELLEHIVGRGRVPEPAFRYWKAGRHAEASLSAALGGGSASAFDGGARQVLGHRTGRGGDTWYVDLGASAGSPIASVIPALAGHARVVAEVQANRLVLRQAAPGGPGRTVERVATMPLADPADRTAVHRFLFAQAAGAAALALAGDLARRVEQRGSVEVDTYAEQAETDDLDLSAKLGAGLGIDRTRTTIHRRLLDARIVGEHARRADCLGV